MSTHAIQPAPMTADDIHIGDVFKPREHRARPRRVVNIYQGYVFYSRGGASTYGCKVKTMVDWLRKNKATNVRNDL